MNELKNWETYSSVSEAENYQNLANLDISDDVSVYNEKEIEYLDRYLPMVKNAFDEAELYDIIIDCNFNDEKIEEIITERVKYMNVKGDQYGWKLVGKAKPKEIEETEIQKKTSTYTQANRWSNNYKNHDHYKNQKTNQNDIENYNQTDYDQKYSEYSNDNYYAKNKYYNKNYDNNYVLKTQNYYKKNHDNNYKAKNKNYNNRIYDDNSKNHYYNNKIYDNNYNNQYNYSQNDYNYYKNENKKRNYYSNDYKAFESSNDYNKNLEENQEKRINYVRNDNYYQKKSYPNYYERKDGSYNNNSNYYGNYYNNNDYNNYSNYVPKYRPKRRALYNYESVVPIDVSSKVNTHDSTTQDFINVNTSYNYDKQNDEIIKLSIENTVKINENEIPKEVFFEDFNKNTGNTLVANNLFEEKEPENLKTNAHLVKEIPEEKDEEQKNEDGDVDLKHYFTILRTGATTGTSEISTFSLLNKLKSDVLNNQYYNNNLNLEKKYENVNNAAINSNSSQKSKPSTNNKSLHLNTQFFEINNNKSTPSSKIQFLDHSKSDYNSQINKLSFSINSSNEKESDKNNKLNNFVIESSSVNMNSNKANQTKQETPISKEYHPNENMRDHYQNNVNNKFKPNTVSTNPNFPNMYNNSPYLYNQEAMNKHQNVNFEDQQQMINNPFYSQSPFYPMPFNYYPFSYDRNMFNMPNTMDPAMMNMYFQFQHHPNFYPTMPSDPYQYSSNINFKK